MRKKKIRSGNEPLDRMLEAASDETLRQLVRCLVDSPESRRVCLEFFRDREDFKAVTAAETDAEIVLTLWDELLPHLTECDTYGGGDYDLVDHAGGLLYTLSQELDDSDVSVQVRRQLLDNVMPYIRSGNSGLGDALYAVACSLCKTDGEWRDFAERLEATGQDWLCDYARRIYRDIGDREKFLQLRSRHMEFGADYHDLATFYWESGEKEKALAVAWDGHEKAKGRMVELREFLAERALEVRDRATFLELNFAQATDPLSLEQYKAFEKLCSEPEWAEYEPRIMKCVSESYSDTRIQIYMYRKDFEAASDVLAELRYPPPSASRTGPVLKAAAKLEKRMPEKVLVYYLSGLGNLNHNATRKHYAHYAHNAKLARRVWVDVLKRPEEWKAFAREIKVANARRRAFQEEFAKAVPGWKDL